MGIIIMNEANNYKIQKALISVSNKDGIVEFAKGLSELGVEITSTGGTAKTLTDAGLKVTKVEEITDFPEIMDGRVKTLHPKIHAGLLGRLDNGKDVAQMKELSLDSIDLLVVNLYPFEETLKKGSTHDELIEKIDIGGPAMLRAAAKNYKWTAPVVNPKKYDKILDELKNNDSKLSEDYRRSLAEETFSHTAYYDSVISGYFREHNKNENPEKITFPAVLESKLRYGENPHQNSRLYGNFGDVFEKLHGKELSHNNIIDIDAAAKLILEFEEPTVAIIKHTNPCGVGTADNLSEAYEKAFATDTMSPFGGIIAVNRTIDEQTAETIHKLFTEVIIAPEFKDEALEILTKKKNRRLVAAEFAKLRESIKYDLKSVSGGFLMQDSDNILYDEEKLKVATKRQPSEKEMKSLLFGWKIVKHVKSNAIVYNTNDRTLGIGAGQMSRVDSARIAVEKAKQMGLSLEGSTIASDAFFPFPDGPLQAIEAGATAIIQPGGSVRDEEVIAAVDEKGAAMVFTGMRHFKH